MKSVMEKNQPVLQGSGRTAWHFITRCQGGKAGYDQKELISTPKILTGEHEPKRSPAMLPIPGPHAAAGPERIARATGRTAAGRRAVPAASTGYRLKGIGIRINMNAVTAIRNSPPADGEDHGKPVHTIWLRFPLKRPALADAHDAKPCPVPLYPKKRSVPATGEHPSQVLLRVGCDIRGDDGHDQGEELHCHVGPGRAVMVTRCSPPSGTAADKP